MPSEVRFAQVLEKLLNDRYKRKRAALAQAAHVSPSALSQYVRGKATPSLEVLANLADALDVSIDYLVFERDERSLAPEAGYLSSQLESGIRQAQTDAAALHDLVARVGARLGEQIRETAQKLLPETSQGAGTLTFEDVNLLEACANHTTIVTSSLDLEVLVTGVPGPFAEVVVNNIKQGRSYEYFVPADDDQGRLADLLRLQVMQKSELPPGTVDELLRVRQVSRACAPGYVVYDVAPDDLRHHGAPIYDRVEPFISTESAPAGFVHIATVEPASSSYRHFGLLDAALVPSVVAELGQLREATRSQEQPTMEER